MVANLRHSKRHTFDNYIDEIINEDELEAPRTVHIK